MKRLVVWSMLLVCFAMLVTPFQAAAASSNVKIEVNGNALKLDVPPYMEQGRVLVPVRGVFENLGLHVQWDQAKQTATIKGINTTISMKLGKNEVLVNGKATKVDTAVSIKDNRLFIPVRFVAENSGASVHWNQANKTVSIKEDETAAFLRKLSQVELNSYSANMEMKQTMKYLEEEMTMDMVMKMDMVTNPLGLYQFMTMTLEELEGESLTTESYLTKDGYYEYDSSFGKWIKYDDSFVEELVGLSEMQMDPTEQLKLMHRFYEDVTIIEHGDTYELRMSISGNGFQDLLSEILNLSGLDMGEDLFADFDLTINKMNVVSIFDKKTFHPISESVESDITMGIDGDTMQIVQQMDASYSNINQLEAITIPQNVIDNAIPFEQYLEELERQFAEAS